MFTSFTPTKIILALALIPLALALVYVQQQDPIKVGIIHSFTGTMAISEIPVAQATERAIQEINRAGGILGRSLEIVRADGASDPARFASEARRLITEEHVDILFGCWTSASRKEVKVVVEELDHLLFYPVQYEGLESSPNIIYMGAAPNQQLIPAVSWCAETFGKRIFFIGSDYIYPRSAHAITVDHCIAIGADIVGEAFIPLGADINDTILQTIINSQPDVIINTINGDSNISFLTAMKRQQNTIPIMSLSIGEHEIKQFGAALYTGHYACWNYFQSIDNPINKQFISRIHAQYGDNTVVNDPMEAAYHGVYLWKQCVEHMGSADLSYVRNNIQHQVIGAPEGIIAIDATNNHAWKSVHIGQAQPNGQFDLCWSFAQPLRPKPYPSTRTTKQWNAFLHELYTGWGNAWAAPTSTQPTVYTPSTLPNASE